MTSTGKGMEAGKPRANRKPFVLVEPRCSWGGEGGGESDEGDRAQAADGCDCRAKGLAVCFFFVGSGEALKVLHRERCDQRPA